MEISVVERSFMIFLLLLCNKNTIEQNTNRSNSVCLFACDWFSSVPQVSYRFQRVMLLRTFCQSIEVRDSQ